jgi:hypothetical protein
LQARQHEPIAICQSLSPWTKPPPRHHDRLTRQNGITVVSASDARESIRTGTL